jgi:hypothetical protein
MRGRKFCTQVTDTMIEASSPILAMPRLYYHTFHTRSSISIEKSSILVPRAGCEFSGGHTLLTLAIVEAKSGSRVWCCQKNTWHAEAAWRMACAGSRHVLLVHARDVRATYVCMFSSRFKRLSR